jgi:valine dehydrogenase (NAD+)
VEGVGKVGHRLVDQLIDDGAEVVICDVNEQAVQRVRQRHPQVEAVADAAALTASDIDVYAPCALGGALNDVSVAGLNAKIVCGGANNQLAHVGVEKQLAERGILYAPDYVVNSGGVIQVADEIAGFNMERARARAAQIFDTTLKIFAMADEEGVPPAVAADRLAERRMSEVGRLRSIWLRR